MPWTRRDYHRDDLAAADAPNQGVTAAAQCMYGIAHAVVAALGCSPGLGFVHSGHERSFVLDIADLYKTEIAIPAAFDAAAAGDDDVPTRTRRALRDRINETNLLERCANDIKKLLHYESPQNATAPEAVDEDQTDRVTLQTDSGRLVTSGRNYADEPIW